MTNAQRLAVRLSEIRSRLNELAANDNPTEEERTETDSLAREYADTERRWRAATIAEGEDNAPANDNTGEGAEYRSLVERAELRGYLAEAATGREAAGAEQELRAAVFGESARAGLVPWEALLRRETEERAASVTAPGDVGANQAGILGRVFADTAAAYLGVGMPMVATGEANFPVLTAGATPEMLAKGGEKSDDAATITATVLEPKRLSARYVFAVEDAARLRGMEEALRADLAGAFGEQMDNQVLNGDDTGANVNGFLNAIAAPDDPADAVTFSGFLSAVSGGIDGRHARDLTGVRTLVGIETYRLASSMMDSNVGAALSDYLIGRSGGFTASALIPAAASDIQDALIHRAARGAGSAVAPVWQGFELIRDPYTNAASGEVAITAVALWSFALLRPGAYGRLKFKLA